MAAHKRHTHRGHPRLHPNGVDTRFDDSRFTYHPTKGWRKNFRNPEPGYRCIEMLFWRVGMPVRVRP